MIDLSNLTPSPFIDFAALVFGLLVGSFLNVLAIRTLAEKSILWPPSHCPRCKHELQIWDNVPVLSWLLLLGKCRYCRGTISWQYPVVEAFTGLTFVALERVFLDVEHSPFNSIYFNQMLTGWFLPALTNVKGFMPSLTGNLDIIIHPAVAPWNIVPHQQLVFLLIGAGFLACTLIAVTVTDFREKLIPHDITYPSMIIGILFSALVRQDLMGAMAGIGASYILFDFIAFYGLKVYLATHGIDAPSRQRRLRRKLTPRRRRRLSRLLRWRLDLATIDSAEEEEPMEVMGGGDAVLSAVMAAYLGWQLLSISLLFGFIIGTVMGLGLLIIEMRKANLLHKCLRTSALTAVGGAICMGVFGALLDQIIGGGQSVMVAPTAVLGAIAGALMGVVITGTRVSKPYPFGPALAAGGFLAVFLLPNWHYLNSMLLTQH